MPFVRYTPNSEDNAANDEFTSNQFNYLTLPSPKSTPYDANSATDNYTQDMPSDLGFMNTNQLGSPSSLAINNVEQSFADFPASFQIPPFMQSGPPPLAPGGGAEVIPAGMMRETGRIWFQRNGFETPQTSTGEDSTQVAVRHVALPQSGHDKFQRLANSSNIYDFNTPSGQIGYEVQQRQQQDIPHGIYSGTGFDLLTVLAKLATRPNPTVTLGPVDMSSSFVVTDARRTDNPIVYCSPNFYQMTGYNEAEVLGRNCRFLQSPNGSVEKDSIRGNGVSMEAVAAMAKACSSHKELQVRVLNYTKQGRAFENLVTLIPLFDSDANGEGHAIYFVGVQVDLSHQPYAIAAKMRDGTYLTNTQTQLTLPTVMAKNGEAIQVGGARAMKPFPPPRMAKEIQHLLADLSLTPPKVGYVEDNDSSHALSSIILANVPDFIHVVSLKGTFLFVSPVIKKTLGYEPEEMVGENLAKFCHPADVVPVMRELKESSAVDGAVGAEKPRIVDLLFRAQVKGGRFVWLECRGRLHVEPGKGRKAILLSARAREMSSPFSFPGPSLSDEGEWWGTVDQRGRILSINSNGLVGWTAKDVEGKIVSNYLSSPMDRQRMEALLLTWSGHSQRELKCRLQTPLNGDVDVQIRFWMSTPPHASQQQSVTAAAIIFQVRQTTSSMSTPQAMGPNVFKEVDTQRNTSWQYELQQVRFENDRLAHEVRVLEHELDLIPPSPSLSVATDVSKYSSGTPTSQPATASSTQSVFPDLSLNTSTPPTQQQSPSPWTSTWDSPGLGNNTRRNWTDLLADDPAPYNNSDPSRKRAWNEISDGGG